MDELTDTITIRMKKSQLEELKKMSGLKNLPLNTFVNQLFSNYLEVDRIYDKFNWIKISKTTLQLAMTKISLKEVEQIGKHIATEFAVDFILTKWGEISEKNIIDFIKIYVKENSYGHCKIFYGSDGTIITIQHKIGKKASRMMSSMVQELFKGQLDKESTIVLDRNSISILIPNHPNVRISSAVPKNIQYTWYKSGFVRQ